MIHKKEFLRKQFASGNFGFFHSPEPTRQIRRACHISKFQINNRNVFTLAPKKKGGGGKHILYLHGGAYVSSFVTFHWKFMAMLVNKTGCTISAPDYPLAPVHTCMESYAMVEQLYSQLLSEASPADIILMGDSSGGGFALSLAQKIRNEHLPKPGRIILLSPWLDITLDNPDIQKVKAVEPFLGIKGLREAGRLYAGDMSLENYLLSPINGSFERLGKLSVFMGSKDILVADARKLRTLLAKQGITINYFEYEDMVHDWMFLNFPESKKAQQQIAELVQGE